ncbi:MAG: methyltransferase family protein [bacterium]
MAKLIFMNMIIIGVFGILVLLLYDLATIYRFRSRALLALFGYGLHGGAIIQATLAQKKLAFTGCTGLGWLFFGTGFGWLVYCLFLFKPIASNYTNQKGPVLTTVGPYAFSRHPGVIGHAVTILGLILVSKSELLLKGGFVWIMANISYVYIQDRWLFPRLFPDYESYRLSIPMILPNCTSLKLFWATTLASSAERQALHD